MSKTKESEKQPEPTVSTKGHLKNLYGLTPEKVAQTFPDSHLTFTQAFPVPAVIVVLGFQGEGKTSLAYWLMDEYHRRKGMGGAVLKGTDAMKRLLPTWVKRPQDYNALKKLEHTVCFIDEAHNDAPARRPTSQNNVDLGALMGLARQRDQLIIVGTHHSRKIDLLEIADASRIVYKKPSLGQMMFERRESKPFTARAMQAFESVPGDSRRWAYVMDMKDLRFGMVKVAQAPWWDERLSVAMKEVY